MSVNVTSVAAVNAVTASDTAIPHAEVEVRPAKYSIKPARKVILPQIQKMQGSF